MTWELLARMVLAIAIGMAIGAERESKDKAAGFRTMTLICLGSALFTIFSVRIGGPDDNAARIAAQIVSGVGFLGAGAIMREGPRVSGLTTAATIWLTASLGMGVGAGDWRIALTAGALSMVVLMGFPHLEKWIDERRETEIYTITCALGSVDRLNEVISTSGLSQQTRTIDRDDVTATLSWTMFGHHRHHLALAERLFGDVDVLRFQT